MKLGIIGRPGCGKTTLFRALGGQRDKLPHAPGAELGLVSVDVPDPRMQWLRELEKPKKFTPARLEFVDFPGIPQKDERGKKELLSSIREMDGLIVLVRGFTDPSYGYLDPEPKPVEEARSLHDEFVLSDYEILGSRIEKLEASVKKPTRNREQELHELALLQRLMGHIEKAGGSLEKVQMSPEEEAATRGFRFLFRKPTLWVLNHPEGTPNAAQLAELKKSFTHLESLCGSIEEEIASLDEADRAVFLKDYGIEEPARAKLIRDAYRVNGLCAFFTTGPDEVRAWTIRQGDNAVTAAGKIHSDLARGFIRAEVTAYADLKSLGSWHEVKAQKKLRLEGKEYIVQDGDIVHIRFSVA